MNFTTASQLFAALSHEVRLKVFHVLVRVGELSATELAECVGLRPSALSFHLKDLRQAGLVETRRDGQWIYYSANFAALTAFRWLMTKNGWSDMQPNPTEGNFPMNSDNRVYNVLFLCTGNSARSIIAECLLNREGMGRFKAYSAGSQPRGEIDPIAAALLQRNNFSLSDLRSKSWDEFSGDDAPVMDFVFTVCDDAAGEVCPVWPGQPMTAHWGVPDPVKFEGTETERTLFTADVFRMLTNRISIFCALPLQSLDKLSLQRKLDMIGKTENTKSDFQSA
ncbi:metalloregulator ArsR/SmtB family transcription factor [Rhodospirillaceae bacterium KN72]|uniref:Metalloregulator ArsR/SmtB family transcription factor n=1 Tax=Pacificispira spongiicola TaxID=2729598 RepID=A0A7Y0DYJ0_9PROT|nr:metalloregulator ArsR/SmtB family transcription factor [Pacificispira spongiicola]NMM43947.1 metalloregulator ArsR/SmtB family transcription factor [Pacificispira spongiicola]